LVKANPRPAESLTRPFQPLLIANAAWLVSGVVLCAALFTPYSTIGDTLGLRRFVTAQITPELEVGQRFRMDADGLNGFEFRPLAVAPVSGSFGLTLRDVGEGRIERAAVITAEELVGGESYVFRFGPIENSANRLFEFTVSSSPENPGLGVALRATKGERLDEGGLVFNRSLRWASLAFETHTTAQAPVWTLLGARQPDRPSPWLALVALVVSWLAMRVALRMLARRQPIETAGS
jgi:hypothetical protein